MDRILDGTKFTLGVCYYPDYRPGYAGMDV